MPNIRIPDLVKHCTVAIYREGKITGKGPKDKFLQCLKIAKAQLSKYGFISTTGDNPTDPIGLTSKGQKAETKHNREGRAKTVLFDTLYDKFDLDGKKAKLAKEQAQKAQDALVAQDVRAGTAKTSKTPTKTAPKPTKKNRI